MRKNASRFKNQQYTQQLITKTLNKYNGIDFIKFIGDYAYFNCAIHGQFKKRLDKLESDMPHICPKCSKQIYAKKVGSIISAKNTIDKYVDTTVYIPLETYINSYTPISFMCTIHNKKFIAKPNRCVGCDDCKYEHHYKWEKDWRHIDQEEIIKRCKAIHPEYDYSLVKYVNATTPMDIICPKHGIFTMSYANLTNKTKPQKCPFCNPMHTNTSKSKLLLSVTSVLDELNIEYTTEKTFDALKDKKALRLDIFIPKYNVVIEIQGAQHFRYVKAFCKNEQGFEYIKYHDKLKFDYCKQNNIKLLYYTSIYNKNIIPTDYFDTVYTNVLELISQFYMKE